MYRQIIKDYISARPAPAVSSEPARVRRPKPRWQIDIGPDGDFISAELASSNSASS